MLPNHTSHAASRSSLICCMQQLMASLTVRQSAVISAAKIIIALILPTQRCLAIASYAQLANRAEVLQRGFTRAGPGAVARLPWDQLLLRSLLQRWRKILQTPAQHT